MKLSENFKLAITSLLANKLRSFMTMLGIIIGIASVITIVNTGDAMSAQQTEMLKKEGLGTLDFYPMQKDMGDSPSYDMNAKLDSIKAKDLEVYQEKFADLVEAVSYSDMVCTSKITKQGKTFELDVTAVNEGFRTCSVLDLLCGRDISKKDLDKKHYVCLVSDTFVNKYFKYQDLRQAIGKKITVPIEDSKKEFEIIGVFEDMYGQYSTSTKFLFPITIYREFKGMNDDIHSLIIKPKDSADQDLFTNTSVAYWKSVFKNSPTTDISYYSGNKSVKGMEANYNQTKMTMGAIGAISLLVGGIGVMNIMMVSVTERTREIGIRMALGAKTKEILLQFVIESIVICLIGGFIGILVGSVAGMAISNTMYQYTVFPSIEIILISLGFSMLVGVFFGYYPAKKASDLDPIEALRYE